MKYLKLGSVFIMVFALFSVASCDDEPLEGEFANGNGGGNGNGGNNTANCIQATTNVADAADAFNQVTISDPNYSTVCNEYISALEDFLNFCGDSTGAVQAIIDSLDCAGNSDCTDAQNASQEAENAYINALQNEISTCGDSDGSLQEIIDNLGC